MAYAVWPRPKQFCTGKTTLCDIMVGSSKFSQSGTTLMLVCMYCIIGLSVHASTTNVVYTLYIAKNNVRWCVYINVRPLQMRLVSTRIAKRTQAGGACIMHYINLISCNIERNHKYVNKAVIGLAHTSTL